MFERILVPVDGSPLSEAILVQVRRLLADERSAVALLTVVPGPVEGWIGDGGLEELRQRTVAHLEDLRILLAGEGVRADTAIRVGDPAREILRYAEECGASLVAMSTHGRTGLERLVRGSVAGAVLRGSGVPVLLVNPRFAGGEPGLPRPLSFRRILVAHDGSEASGRIVPVAETFARLHGSELVLFHVRQDPEAPARFAEVERDLQATASALRSECERLAEDGVPARLRIGTGAPAAEILIAAREEKADLIALTTHGRTGLPRAWLGSVAEQVLRRSALPLLVRRTVPVPEPSPARVG
ncbi:MAG: universal stress protein [Planctomycetales bacterium]|nr:universal stress protein [Planctomycetales bacterium]